jgi:hypothetical protein
VNYRSMISALAASIVLAGCSQAAAGNLNPGYANPSSRGAVRKPTVAGERSKADHGMLFIGYNEFSKVSVAIFSASKYEQVGSIPSAIRPFVSPNGELYALGGGGIEVFNKKLKLVRTLTRFIDDPRTVVFDSIGTVYVAQRTTIAIFPNGKQSRAYTIKARLATITVDPENNLYIGMSKKIAVYPPGSRKIAHIITQNVQDVLAMITDSRGNLYVGNQYPLGEGSVSVYNAPSGSYEYSLGHDQGIVTPIDFQVGADGNLYVLNGGWEHVPETITIYPLGGTTLLRTITSGLDVPSTILVDPSGYLYAANVLEVVVYAPGSSSVLHTIQPTSETEMDGLAFRP